MFETWCAMVSLEVSPQCPGSSRASANEVCSKQQVVCMTCAMCREVAPHNQINNAIAESTVCCSLGLYTISIRALLWAVSCTNAPWFKTAGSSNPRLA
jgi:hypothetical protein